MAIGSLTVTPNAAAQAYAKVASDSSAGGDSGAGSEGFGAALSNALGSAVQTGQQADAMAARGLMVRAI